MDIEIEDLYAAITAGERATEALDHFAPPVAPGFVRRVSCAGSSSSRSCAGGSRRRDGPSGFDEDSGQFTGWTVRVLLDDWRPGDRRSGERRSPEAGLESGLGAATDLQLFRSVA